MRKLSVVSLFCLIFFNSFAQDHKFVPNAPDAAAFLKHINYPVSHNTGVTNVSIPLHEDKSGDIAFPLLLNYHTGGIKVNEQSSWVGLGWNLPTPQITRQINGKPDEIGYLLNSSISTFDPMRDLFSEGSTNTYWHNLANLEIDEQPDVFNYSLLSGGGSFMFQKTGASTYIPVAIPYTPIKIDFTHQAIAITDLDGTEYLFDQTETTIEYNSVTPYPTGWKCSRIISSSKKDTIVFEYKANRTKTIYSFPEKVEVEDNYTWPVKSPMVTNFNAGEPEFPPYDGGPFHPNNTYNNYGIKGMYTRDSMYSGLQYKRTGSFTSLDVVGMTWSIIESLSLEKIKYRGGMIQFYSVSSSINGDKLDSIKVFSPDNKIVKTIRLYLSFINSSRSPGSMWWGDDRMRLDSVVQVSPIGPSARYSLLYESYVSGSYFYAWNKFSDTWGYNNYYTGSYSTSIISVPLNSTVVNDPYLLYNSLGYYTMHVGGRSGEVNESMIKAYSLSKIIYPTGGWTEFEYASNKYMNSNDEIKSAGGLRIEKIKYFDGTSVTSSFEKIYKYGPNENGAGEIKFEPSDNDFRFEQYIAYDLGGKRRVTFLNRSLEDLGHANGCPVNYTTVTEYQKDNGINTGKTVYTYSSFPTGTVLNPELRNSSHIYNTDITVRKIEFEGGQLLSTTHYARSGGDYVWVNKKENQYTKYAKEAKIHIGRIFRKIVYMETIPTSINGNEFNYYPYGQEVGTMLLTSQQNESRDLSDLNNVLTTNVQYYYDNDIHLQVTRSRNTGSDGKVWTNFISYPQDYSSGTSFVDNMVTGNVINQPIETITMVESGSTNRIVNGIVNTYTSGFYSFPDKTYKLSTSIPIDQLLFKFSNRTLGQLPTSGVSSGFSMDSRYEEEISYEQFDSRGQPVEVKGRGDTYKSYIWDYDELYVVAEAINAKAQEIAYTSFETNDNGGWILSDTSRYRSEKLTGKQSYRTSPSYTISKTGLSTGQSFIVSYWSMNGSATVNGVTGQQGITKNGWTYWEHILSGISSVVITGSYLIIDELRLMPRAAQMTTYAYQPLVGQISSCDVRNNITYYEYDSLNRLSIIRDQDKNIVKRICYNYAGQEEDCGILFYNQVQSGSFTRNNCLYGYTGSTVVYGVPANTYGAATLLAANQLAQNDVAANGQAYANANGTCTLLSTLRTITAFNGAGTDFTAAFTNTATSLTSFFFINNGMWNQSVGQLPEGVYDITITPTSSSFLFDWNVGGYSLLGYNIYTRSSAVIDSNVDITIYSWY